MVIGAAFISIEDNGCAINSAASSSIYAFYKSTLVISLYDRNVSR